MSVILTASKRAVKPKSARPKSKRPTRPAAVPQPMASGQVAADNVKMWQSVVDGCPIKIIFRKDTMQVWLNGEEIDTMDTFSDEGAVKDFEIAGHKARIIGSKSGKGMVHSLTIDGYCVPEESAQ